MKANLNIETNIFPEYRAGFSNNNSLGENLEAKIFF